MIKTEIIEAKGKIPKDFYESFACPEHHFTLCEMQPFHFSFNVPSSACGTCSGIGLSHVVEPRFLVVSPEKSIMKGALKNNLFNPAGKDSYRSTIVYSVAKHFGFNLDTPWCELSDEARDVLLYGSRGEVVTMVQPPFAKKRNWIVGRSFPYGGFVRDIEGWYRGYIRRTTGTESIEPDFIRETMIEKTCPECKGARLKRQRLSIRVNGKNIHELTVMQLPDLMEFLLALKFHEHKREVAESIVREVCTRLQLLVDIGLYYLNLGRRSDSISGGEMQRIKMSTQISSELMGMLYVMDEPSIGLHARDSSKVINIMKKLRDIGNTVLVVEHDLETMRSADYLVEIGPGSGVHGGNIIAFGTKDEVEGKEESVTGAFLSGRRSIAVPGKRRVPREEVITIQGARENNLKNITVDIPLGVFACITGVSGSGKSTLINETLFKKMEILKKQSRIVAGEHDVLFGDDNINNVINIDQSAIGRSSKSNPATYIGIYDRIRDLFASTPEAVSRGYRPIDFSLTHANGTRCEHCTGDGVIVTNLQFMADIETICPVCKGMRFSQEGLEVKYKGKDIGQVLDMTVTEALSFFEDNKYLHHKLSIMDDLGLGYITLGQSSTTLSGGEAQRVKLAYELSKIKRGNRNLYILDEPTTGLHILDIEKLLKSINRLVDQGHSVLIIEHNLDIIKCCDYIIDMGPEGGQKGGWVVAEGTPEQVAQVRGSYTGQFLKLVLEEAKRTN
ncbi:MAG: excinuclease ABC subunit UvrA [Eubacteriales bacterium]